MTRLIIEFVYFALWGVSILYAVQFQDAEVPLLFLLVVMTIRYRKELLNLEG
jgi:hypothetical protein